MMWRIGILGAIIIAAAVMAYQIGSRLSDEAIMTIVGVACGIAASIPVSIGLLIALTRERATYAATSYSDASAYAEPEPEPEPYNIYRSPNPPHPQLPTQPSPPPQIIVVTPPQTQLPQNFSAYGNYLAAPQNNALPAPMQERTFRIVGEDEGE